MVRKSRKFSRAVRRTGRLRHRRKMRFKRKAGKAKRNYGIRTLKSHRERINRKPELKWVTNVISPVGINSINESGTSNYFFTQIDPSVYSVHQGTGLNEHVGVTINTISVELEFDLIPADLYSKLDADYFDPGIVADQIRVQDCFAACRVLIVEAKSFLSPIDEIVAEISTTQELYAKPNIKLGKVMYDKTIYNSALIVNDPATHETKAPDYFPIAANQKRRHFKWRIPYKATLPIQNASENPEVKKPMYLIIYTSMTSEWVDHITPPETKRWMMVDYYSRLWYVDP